MVGGPLRNSLPFRAYGRVAGPARMAVELVQKVLNIPWDKIGLPKESVF